MATHRRKVLKAFTALVEKALPGATVKLNPKKAATLAPGGAANVRPGTATAIGTVLNPYRKIWSHGLVLELAAKARDGVSEDDALDEMVEAVEAAVRADRTLGGLVDFLDPEFPELEPIEVVGAEDAGWSGLTVTAEYVA
ncbi:MAG TPA: hypothetical protein VEI97_15805 [bacterium]|nr:hypothetical protein [bacterium]